MKMKVKNKYFFPIGSWIIFVFITVARFKGLNNISVIQLDMAQLVMIIAVYLMLGTIIQFVKSELIKKFFYVSSSALIIISGFLIEKYYHQNAIFMESQGFFNPSLLPFIFAIVLFITPLIKNQIEKVEKED